MPDRIGINKLFRIYRRFYPGYPYTKFIRSHPQALISFIKKESILSFFFHQLFIIKKVEEDFIRFLIKNNPIISIQIFAEILQQLF